MTREMTETVCSLVLVIDDDDEAGRRETGQEVEDMSRLRMGSWLRSIPLRLNVSVLDRGTGTRTVACRGRVSASCSLRTCQNINCKFLKAF